MGITVWQASEAGAKLQAAERPPLEPAANELVLEVLHCGLCHSDLSMLNNHWGITSYPLIPGHEVVGRVVSVGSAVNPDVIGELRGLGWISGSCCHCIQCLGGTGNLCASLEATIVGRQGGFASHVTAHQDWAIPLPEGIDPGVAGPLFCAGITVFSPLIDEAVSPTAHVAVIGIGGLGHIALQFARAWGCEVTAITTNLSKTEEAKRFGAHQVESIDQLSNLAGKFDLIINTVNHSLDWAAVMASLAPLGRLHQLGAVIEPIQVGAFDLIMARRSITGSPTSSPASLLKMVDFCVRHNIRPQVEHLPINRVNEAVERLQRGDVRYRFVLDLIGN
ncbi:NAD(P)-dependent alcohol dehydrogenase [Synechococcus lacustris C3-12m-Tous]|uniref:NAD(P)-dependent alcohol dehydrogenase n=1 Tax=Synechococcus lacustris TaxID=2116544 RepID=UPI0020CF5453|nr:NAD(P)-dependent alcohol dehydrogenase [Synechococcus lacustris]MCP9925910.1 NAD(P)-dependent alcohol dehydrogenase [Synechococcus lacustris C3-12m-Tous]